MAYNVCHVVSGDLWAGAEAVTYQLIKGLLNYQENIKCSAIVFNAGKFAHEIRGLGIPVYLVNESTKLFPQMFLDMRKILNQAPFDIIHSHRHKENSLAYLMAITRKGLQLIATQHGMPEVYSHNDNFKYRLISKANFMLLSRSFNCTVAVSRDIENTLVNSYSFPKYKVKVIHNGVEIPQNASSVRSSESFVVGSSGRFFAIKDYPLMVEIARKLSEKANNIRFELAGDGPERANIQSLINKYGLEERFILRGFMENTAAFYKGLDLYLNTSIHEGIPMSVLEAMSHGLPVVAPRVGGLNEIVEDGREGYLLKNRDPKEFADMCLRIYENTLVRQQMSAAARDKVAKDFSIELMAREYYNLYLEAIKKRST